MPNWKNEEDYKYCEKLNHEGWAWEFLRRLASYQDDYSKAACEQQAYEENVPKKLAKPPFLEFHEIEGAYYYPPKDSRDTVLEWYLSVENAIVRTPLEHYGNKWGLKGEIIDPSKSIPSDYFVLPKAPLFRPSPEQLSRLMGRCDDDGQIQAFSELVAVAVFDLRMPITKQVNEISKKLRKAHKACEQAIASSGGQQLKSARWVKYLRILDSDVQSDLSTSVRGAIILEEELKALNASTPSAMFTSWRADAIERQRNWEGLLARFPKVGGKLNGEEEK